MPKETSKIKALISFVSMELIMFGVSLVIADIGFSDVAIPKAAIFLGVALFFHLATAWGRLRNWRKEQEYPISTGEL